MEFEVQRILSFSRKSKERRQEIMKLKKRGNFINNRTNATLRPVKRLEKSSVYDATDFLPCKYCLGFYKKKALYRHTKHCISNHQRDEKGKRQTSQSDGQTALLANTFFKHDEFLKKEVFPRMRPDEISLIAKQDPLICQYGYSYLKGRRSKGNLDLVRQNMRRLAKLMKIARKEDGQIKQLLHLLKPRYFQLIVKCVSILALYNADAERYESPTLAMNFGTLLKKSCDLGLIHLLQQNVDTSSQREDLKLLKILIESQWSNEISAQAATNLNENKWNKNELLPLTSDLKKLQEYLSLQAEQALEHLQTSPSSSDSYCKLKECLYVQIILLNRRRPAEVAQLKVQTYKSISLEPENDNELQKCLTETERILLNTYSRIVIRGKRGRGVPVLLSPRMKCFFDKLISVRDTFITGNDYVFHTNGKGFIDGTKTINKYATKCRLENPKAITATRLRKHLATITQLLQFSNSDMEQLSKFMGHTLKTHCDVYRMSDNMYQTAKVSKLLILMTQGGAEQFVGKNLEEINFDLDPVYENVEIAEEATSQSTSQCPDIISCIQTHETLDNSDHLPRPDSKSIRQHWTKKQKQIISRHFEQNIKHKKPPTKKEVDNFMTLYPSEFGQQKWTSVKAVVYNMYTGKLKM